MNDQYGILPLNSSVNVRGAGGRVAVCAGTAVSVDGTTLGVSGDSIVGVPIEVGVSCEDVGVVVLEVQAAVIKIKNKKPNLFRFIIPNDNKTYGR